MSDLTDDGKEGSPRAAQQDAFDTFNQALDGKKKRRRRPRRQGGGFRFSLFPILITLAVAFVVIPFLWITLYRFIEAPTTTLIQMRKGAGETIRHAPVALSQMSPHLVRAVIAAEDARFCTHKGFDMDAMQAAYEANQKASNQERGKVRGGSTISQQTAKNLFLWPQRSFVRKGLEAYFTTLIEFAWPKRRILQAYLNAAEWGDGVFGAEAAARAMFNVSAIQLTPRQAALLAAVLPSPNKWSATKPGPYVRRRAAAIQARMWALRQQGLDSCVLDRNAAPPPAPKRKPPADVMPPLEPLPPDVAIAADAPVFTPMDGGTAPPEAAMSAAPGESGGDAAGEPEMESPAEPEPPADAPSTGAPAGAPPG
ncbi:MAG: monofunctional biosynthetic peptidoglycan transglycosylase [Hyphomonadaceae bacterium]